MGAMLIPVMAWLASSLVARVLVGAGLTLLVTAGLGTMATDLLNAAASNLSSGTSDVLALCRISGLMTGITLIGSAIITRYAIAGISGSVSRISGVGISS